ncbi:MAG: peptidoglycan bridge formation glycyltransferase FemA/FemB family protein [Spirochaetales bacterium]|nr:peptidoglycan bridge formation glycyltransferase FemA/FemB family protein [Spirochaetales bacterium]
MVVKAKRQKKSKVKFTVKLEPVEAALLPAPNLLQSGFWAAFKESFGWKGLAFMIHCSAGDHAMDVPLVTLTRPLAAGYHLAYIPHGPAPSAPLPGEPCDCLEALAKALKPFLPKKTLFIRFDVPWGAVGADNFPQAICKPLIKAAYDVQPPDTVIIPLNLSEEDILSCMKPKTRYNTRLAEKKGVRVYEGGPADIPLWYGLYQETAERDGITLHGREYYEGLFSLADSYAGSKPRFHLLLAEAEGKLIAGNIAAVFGPQAYYLYGAASNEMRNYMASYALQWEGMKLAKREGALTYDLFGIPPNDDPSHAMYGLYRFKTGFGGEILHRPGSYDYPLKFFAYRAYRIAESLRAWYYKSFRKRNRRKNQAAAGE